MKRIFYLSLTLVSLAFISACATLPNNERAGVTIGTLYKFSSPKLDSSLYVKFLPAEGKDNALLFATFPNSQPVNDLHAGDKDVYKQDWYNVSRDGSVSFRYYEKGNFRELMKHHKYFSSGSQNGDTSSFHYRLDFTRAVVVSK